MMEDITQKLSHLSTLQQRSDLISEDRLQTLEQMTVSATLMLELLLKENSLLDAPSKLES
jgi:hypothetical protein